MSEAALTARRKDANWLIVAPVVAVAWLLASHGLRGALTTVDPALSGRTGAWLSELVVWALQPLTVFAAPETVLQVFSAGVLGVLAAYVLRRLLYNDWPLPDAAILVGAVAANALLLDAVLHDQGALPVMIAFAAVIPGLRRLESVGDAQAEMSFGLVLPLLFLAGPATALLVLPLAIMGALLDPLARQDRRAFVAMFLVALMPTLLVVVGIAAFAGWREIISVAASYKSLIEPHPLSLPAGGRYLLVFAATVLPFAPIFVAYSLSGDDRRRQPLSAALVWLLPAYLLLGAIFFSWPIAPAVPGIAFLGAFVAWLSVARLHRLLRCAAVAIAIATALLSWAI
jgi:hypothetical protein